MFDCYGSDLGRRLLRMLATRSAVYGALCTALVCALSSRAAAEDFRILYFEQLEDSTIAESTEDSSSLGQPTAATLSFYAFGRQFELALERNDALTRNLVRTAADESPAIVLYRGSVVGIAESWVRLTSQGGVLSGAISVNDDVYAIEQYDRVAAFLVSPSATPGGTIIYRLRDTAGRFGDHVGEPLSLAAGLARRMSAELPALAASVAGAQIDIGLVADAELVARYTTGVEAMVLNTANIVDGIFGEQLRVHLNVAELAIHESEPDPFTSDDPATLLNELADYKDATPSLRGLGLVHLLTGRKLANTGDSANVVGIANLAALCNPRLAVSLTEAFGRDYVSAALIAAHEIGHNFGAPHDAAPGSMCESTPSSFLMAAVLNSSDRFSDCSLEQMRTEVASAACVTPVPPNDLSINADIAPSEVPAGKEFNGSVLITNPGPNDALGVEVVFETSGIHLSHPNGFCTSTSTGSVCTLYRVAAGKSASVPFFGFGTRAGHGTITATVTSWNDPNPANDRLTFDVDFLPSVQFETQTAEAPPALIHVGETVKFGWDITNVGISPATNVELEISIPAYLEPLDFVVPGGGICTQNAMPTNWSCSIPAVPRNAPQRLKLHARASSAFLPPAGSYFEASVIVQVSSAAEAMLGPRSLASALVRIASTFADLALEMQAPETPVQGSRISVVLTGRNDGPDKATNLVLKLWNGGSSTGRAIAVENVESTASACTVTADGDVECQIAELPSSSSFTVTVTGLAQAERYGGYSLQAYLESDVYDPRPGSAMAFGSLHPTAPPPSSDPPSPPAAPPPASQGGGGGGAIDLSSLLYLLALLAGRTGFNTSALSRSRTKRSGG